MEKKQRESKRLHIRRIQNKKKKRRSKRKQRNEKRTKEGLQGKPLNNLIALLAGRLPKRLTFFPFRTG
tara:strand:+ start:813 stop:1016 length:204 start_codon:yes stop_codon:yes gene_type:complete